MRISGSALVSAKWPITLGCGHFGIEYLTQDLTLGVIRRSAREFNANGLQ
jgi:hypothetical protein